jgi:hypothetical protein
MIMSVLQNWNKEKYMRVFINHDLLVIAVAILKIENSLLRTTVMSLNAM